MIINHNIAAINTHRQLSNNNTATQNSLEKLSSGLQINKAGDDAAGLAISEKMRGQIRGLEMASKNAQDGISLVQTAEGALSETHDILQRMRELAVQSSNDTNNDVDRKELQKEMNQLIEEIDRISNDTEFNTKALLDGSFTDNKFHIGANEGQSISLSIESMGTGNIGEVTKTTTVYSSDEAFDASTTDYSGDTNDKSITIAIGEENHTIKLDKDYTNAGGVLAAVNDQLAGTGITAELGENDKINLSSDAAFKVDNAAASV